MLHPFKRSQKLKNVAGTVINPATEDKQDNIITAIEALSSNVIDDELMFFEDTSFVTGDSPVTLDLNAALGRNATKVNVINDGDGDFTVKTSKDGTVYGDAITLKKYDELVIDGVNVDSLIITWVSDSSYRVIYV